MVMIPIVLLLVASASAQFSVNLQGPRLNVQADGSGIGLPSAIGTGVAQSLDSSLQSLVGKLQGGITHGLTAALAQTAGGRKAMEINKEIVDSMLGNGFSRDQIEERMRGLISEIKKAGADVDKITGAITDFANENGVQSILQKNANELSAAVHNFASRHNVTEAEEKARQYVKDHGSLGQALDAAKADGKEIVADGQAAWNMGGASGILNYAQKVMQRVGLGNITNRLINRARNMLEDLMSPRNIRRLARMMVTGMQIPPPFSGMLVNILSQAMGGEAQAEGSLGIGQGFDTLSSIVGGINGQMGLPSISGALAGLGGALNGNLASSMGGRLNGGLLSGLNAALTQGGRLANQASSDASFSLAGRPAASWNMGRPASSWNMGRPSLNINSNAHANSDEREGGRGEINVNFGRGRDNADGNGDEREGGRGGVNWNNGRGRQNGHGNSDEREGGRGGINWNNGRGRENGRGNSDEREGGRVGINWNNGRGRENGHGNSDEREGGRGGINVNLGRGREAGASVSLGGSSGFGSGLGGGSSLLGQMTQAAGQVAGGLAGAAGQVAGDLASAASNAASMGIRVPMVGFLG